MHRIVHNEQTGSYRVERRGMLGWAFVSDPQTGDYLTFADIEAARAWVRSMTRPSDNGARRWKIVSDCNT